MAPTRPRMSIVITMRRQPLREHIPLSPTTNARFWREYATRNQSLPVPNNRERFWQDRSYRRPRIRTQSEPPSPRRLLPLLPVNANIPRAQPARESSRIARAFRVVKTIATRSGRWAYETGRRPRVKALGKLVAATLIAYVAYSRTVAQRGTQIPPSLRHEVDMYKTFPTWMYTNPHNILGLEPSPFGVAPGSVINRAWRRFNLRFHTDKWQNNGFHSPEAAAAAFKVGLAAHEAFVKYYKNPYCAKNTSPLLNFQAPHETLGIPHFAKDCTCTAANLLAKQVLDAFFPARVQALVAPKPTTSDLLLSTVCPCTPANIDTFRNNLAGSLAADSVPPHLRRIYDLTSWRTLSPRVLWWKLSVLLGGWEAAWKQSDAEQQRWEHKVWAVPTDWEYEWARGCPIYKKDYRAPRKRGW
ncbi:hypothetical protein BDU57DRAFT_113607 [Ampelomyces quisqualis]|uniref:Uncharacterized protein n=1 Tax=Ampelomyces quisqualis TaxID=50730 RepID=A0A6A5Q5H9_AMPQU|nr:hypothetical protein BDU57DRAFT_113607 [Ampelomyces quisqualis]